MIGDFKGKAGYSILFLFAFNTRFLCLTSFVLQLFRIILFLMLAVLSGAMDVSAQTPLQSNYRQKKIPVIPGTGFTLDSLSIIPSTFRIEGVDSLQYTLDYMNAVLYWKLPPTDSVVTVSYRVFSFPLQATAQRMRYDSLILYSTAPIKAATATADGRSLFNFGNINAQGSFGRQVGFGNNQDMVLNSNLNIQLNGMLADSIELQAAITDNNIPIQPDGNTQQLNEFDEVYIRFKKKNWQLNIGDMDQRADQHYFMKFYKRLQGISFQTANDISERVQSHTLVSASVARGKFARNVFEGLEGNQGPYRLTGANNEIFFIVLANTERVFIDGRLMQRGEDQDYIINYNTAEITFTPRQMITKDSRIQVEFEYADRNFLNTNLYASQEFDFNKKLKLRASYFGNSDAKNSSVNQVLDTRQKQFLFDIGDSVHQAYYPSAVTDSFSAGKILYERVHDTIDNRIDSFYRYSIDPATARYNLAFTEVGYGQGNYIPDNGNANGKVFVYVPPSNGVRQGNYEPVVLLVAPKKQHLLSVGMDYNLTPNTLLKAELAASDYDVNTFSKLNDGDNKGYAARLNIANTKLLREKNKLSLVTALDYEYVQDKFQPIERLREVEFTRDWGLPLVTEKATENIIKGSAGLKGANGNFVQYGFTNYHRSDNYNGFQNALSQFTGWKTWTFNNHVSMTRYSTDAHTGYFLKPVIDIGKTLPWLNNWILGAKYTLEENVSRAGINDSLMPLSFSFDTYKAYLRSGTESANRYEISFYTRSDKYPVGKELVRGDRSYNLNLQAELLSNSKRQFYLNTTFRKLKVYDEDISHQSGDNTVLTRAEYQMNEWNGFLNGNILYEVGAGQEQKREYAYLEVPAGTGQYTWRDYNEDGVQQLNEFELAVFSDQAQFIRIFTPTNEYIKANYTTFNYNLNLTPKQLWKKNDLADAEKFFSRFIVTSALQIAKKSQAEGRFEFSPFGQSLNDSSLITLTTVLANTLSFNRQSTKWGLDISNLNNSNKAFLTYGYETRQSREWLLKYRHFISRAITFNLNTLTGRTELYTDDLQFDNRNYAIDRNNAEALLSFVKGTVFRVTGGYKYEVKNNDALYGGERSVSHALSAETKYNILQSASVSGRFTYNGMQYSAAEAAHTSTGYVMLDGLLPGRNFLWNMMLTKRLLNNLELTFQYDGRKPGGTKTIHTGRASLTALF